MWELFSGVTNFLLHQPDLHGLSQGTGDAVRQVKLHNSVMGYHYELETTFNVTA